jgi:putative SOS response-associated peptidase YedK
MCFKVEIHITRTEIESRFGRRFPESESFEPKYYFSAFENPKLPVITASDPNVIKTMEWGLVPFWTKNPDQAKELKFNTLNAKAETLAEKPSFRHTLQSQRCLIICHGFFEWQHRGKEKIPHYIKLKDNQPFAFAGVYDIWKNVADNSDHIGFSLITCPANPLMEKIHNSKKRMPVILSKDNEEAWIDSNHATDNALKLLTPLEDELMEAWEIEINSNLNLNTSAIIEKRKSDSLGNQLSLF